MKKCTYKECSVCDEEKRRPLKCIMGDFHEAGIGYVLEDITKYPVEQLFCEPCRRDILDHLKNHQVEVNE